MATFFRHPLTLRILSVAIVFSAWEYAGRIPISPAFPTFLQTMSALFSLIPVVLDFEAGGRAIQLGAG